MQIPERSQWLRALTAVPRDDVMALTGELTSGWQLRPKALPQTGLGMLRMSDGAFHQAFNLGEIPLATAWIELGRNDRPIGEGAAQVMDDDIDLAQALAVCDAIVAGQLDGWQQVVELMAAGLDRCAAEASRRNAMLASTRVDFSLLDAVGDDDEA